MFTQEGISCRGTTSLLLFCAGFVLAQAASGLLAQGASAKKETDWSVFLPAGKGQMQVSSYCTSCHNLKLVVADRRTDEDGWNAIVEDMVSRGAAVPEEDIPVMAGYLAQYFANSTPKLELPIAINSQPKEILRLLPDLTDTEVNKLLDARKDSPLTNFSSLEAVIGKEKANGIRDYISFSDRQ